MPGGRPTKYDKKYCEQVTKLCLLGATNQEIADFFGINVDTYHRWVETHKEFSDAVQAGKIIADANVAKSLYQRAVGASHPEEKVTKDGDVIEVTRHYPPETGAANLWLKNRRRNLEKDATGDKGLVWTDKQENELSGPGGGPIFDSAEIARRLVFLIQKGIHEGAK